jgi:hypothetical protein
MCGDRQEPQGQQSLLKHRDCTSLRFPFACLANKRRKVAITPDNRS